MFEKVNPAHPDKVADRIAGAIVDLAYSKQENPRVAVEVLLGHGDCYIIIESSCDFSDEEIEKIVTRIAGRMMVFVQYNQQDKHLSDNQSRGLRCGDNGIFCGVPTSSEEELLSKVVREIYETCPYDGKYIISDGEIIGCQSHMSTDKLETVLSQYSGRCIANPLGEWDGGTNVDSGATNRKLGSDMGRAVTGGGLHGKDLSKADVSVNIYAHLLAQKRKCKVELSCAIGDEYVDGKPYWVIVDEARKYIESIGGFEKFAEWGLI